MSRENARQTENAWKNRDAEAAANQERAGGFRAGDVRFGMGGASGGGSIKVHITGADDSFFEALKKSMGMGSSTGSSGPNPMNDQLQALLSDQQAISQATKQIAQDLKLAATMVLDFQGQAAKAMGSYANDMKLMRQDERDHLQRMTDAMQQAAQAQQQAAQALQQQATQMMAGTGGGGGGGGYPTMTGALYPASGYGPSSPPPPPPPAPPQGGGPGPGVPPGGSGGGAHGAGGVPYTSMGRLRNRIIQRVGGPNSARGRMIRGFSHGGLIGAARAVPGLGLAVGAFELANSGMTWVTEQRAANANYQAIYGGDNFSLGGAIGTLGSFFTGQNTNDTSGFGQRMQEEGFVLGQRFSGGLTSDQARQAFKGVSSLGYAGDRRQNSLDFITKNYSQMGMDVSQSLQLVQASAQYSNQSLANLTNTLQKVTAAAAATGQSADVLRQQFSSTYATALTSGMGAGSAGLAQAMVMSTSGTSRDLAGVNYSGMMSNPVIAQRIAATGGLTLGQMESQVSSGNIQAFTKPAQQIINQTLTGTMDQNVRSLFSSAVQGQGGYANVAKSPGAQYSIAQQLLNNRSWNVMSARAALGTMGINAANMSDQQVAEYYVSTLTSGGLQGAAQSQSNQNKQSPITGSSDAVSLLSGNNMLAQLRIQQGKKSPDLFDSITKLWGGDTATHNAENLGSIADAYQGFEQKYKVTDPAIEAAIKSLGTNTGTQIRVHTQTGDQVVSVADAIKYYSDQLSNGSAYVVGGQFSGKRLSDITGVTDTGFVPGRGGAPNSGAQKAVSGVGQSWTDYEKSNPGQQGNAASQGAQQVGTVTVSLDPQVAALFNFNTTGGVNIQGAAAAGVPPTVMGGSH